MEKWEEKLSCAVTCHRCHAGLKSSDKRILSAYDHEPICMACKSQEEQRPDYETVSREAIGSCLVDTELQYGDPRGYCFHHFYPFTCK